MAKPRNPTTRNDTLATTLEPLAAQVAGRAIGPVGWTAGKHG